MRTKLIMTVAAAICFIQAALPARAGRTIGLDRDWKVYLVQHTHTDIGYTKPQTEILSEHLRYIDYAIDYADLTKDYPEDSKFRWTCEAAWAVSEYIKVRPKEQIERLKDCIRRGQIEVTAMYFNMAEVADENSLRYFLQPLKPIKELGIPVSVAMQNDVNGAAWCLADYLPDIGVSYLWMGENETRSIAPFSMPTVYRWESPSGKSMYGYRSEHYMTGNFWGIHDGDIEKAEESLTKYLRSLEDKGYPFDAIAIQYSGTFTDNAPPSYSAVCKLITEWNSKYDSPKLRSATAHEFMDYVTGNFADKINTYRAAYPDWWTDGFGSAPLETDEARKTQADMLSNQALLSMAALLGTRIPEGTVDEIKGIHKNLLFYDEHTFGADRSISDPTGLNTILQFNCKTSYAWDAQKRSKMLFETSGGLLQGNVRRDEVPTITLFNPLAWRRDALCDVFIDYEVIPAGRDFRIVDYEGTEIPAQAYASRSEGRYYRLYVKNMPSLGFRTFKVLPGKMADYGSEVTVRKDLLENNYYKISIDTLKGCITSIYDKSAKRELVDRTNPWGLGRFIFEKLADRSILNKDGNTPLATVTGEGITRFAPDDMSVADISSGPLYSSIILAGQCEGLADPGLKIEIRLHNNAPLIELAYTVRKNHDVNPVGLYVAFPFTGDKLRFDVQGGMVSPGENQIEGTASDWNTIQNFVSARDDNAQTVLSSRDVPLVMLGKMLEGTYQYYKHYDHPHVYSWVMNNYWFTNFNADQSGEFTWQYTITSTGSTSDTDALKFSMGDRVRLYGRVLPPAVSVSGRSSWSAFDVSDPDIVITSVTPAAEDGCIILQARETSGKDIAKLELKDPSGKKIPFDIVNVLESPIKKNLTSLSLDPFENVFVRIRIPE